MSTKDPLISVVVTVYNEEKYIGRCLRSLLKQSIPSNYYEIIVVNDGSTDRTSYALELFHDSIRTINNNKNIGLPASINRGIEASKGLFLVRVDSDDFVNYYYISYLHSFLEYNSYMDAVACDYYLVDSLGNWLERVNCMDHPIGCGIIYYKQHLIDIGLYDENFRIFEEREMRIRFENKYSIYRLELPLYRYRKHSSNLTNDKEAMKVYYQKLISKHGIDKV
jgi:glycosyltransferase involved in cell wall biosynthesis